MEKILNLTQHNATKEQIIAGVAEPSAKEEIKMALTFGELPTKSEIELAVKKLVEIAKAEGAEAAMIGGAPFLMGPLERGLAMSGIRPLYAFSKRVVVEKAGEGGEVIKTAIFKHEGFVEAL